MKETRFRSAMRIMALFIALSGLGFQARAQNAGHTMPHEMQHGFILAADDKFASHLVATGHHSRQVEITGQLSIDDPLELANYQERRSHNASGDSYFLFQAQGLDLPSVKVGQVLSGHIVESKMGGYEPKNVVVKKATFRIDKMILNIPNPFFLE